jgi:hypothetical protein
MFIFGNDVPDFACYPPANSLSMQFTESQDTRISIPDSASLAITQSLTLDAYIDPFSTENSGAQIVFRGDDRPALDPYSLNVVAGTINFGVADDSGGGASVGAPLPGINKWLFIAGTLNNTTGAMDLYINGTLAATTTTTERPYGPLAPSENPGVGIGNVESGDPVAAIAGYLASGCLNGLWTGVGINSSTAAKNPALAVGYADGNTDVGTPAAPNQILVKTAISGDAILDGTVDSADLLAVVQNFNKTGTDWAGGNFTYGRGTDSEDLLLVIQNFNKTLTADGDAVEESGGSTIALGQSAGVAIDPAAVRVPEPGIPGLAWIAVSALLARRRRRV